MALTKFRTALGSGASLGDFLKFGAWKGLILGDVGQALFVHGPKAEMIGEDCHGNKYFEGKNLQQGRHRFVVYHDLDNKDPSTVPPQWHSWLNYVSDAAPGREEWPAIKFAPAIHPKHPSGTPQEYHPKGHYLNPQRRQWKKMEFWQP
eukprot:jgi/Tetstr1/463214/TSEL_008145.t1